MRQTLDVTSDELPEALRRAADFLGRSRIRLERLTLITGSPSRLTAEFPANTAATTVERFARAVGRPADDGTIPFHWQADGAGDDRGV